VKLRERERVLERRAAPGEQQLHPLRDQAYVTVELVLGVEQVLEAVDVVDAGSRQQARR
jgi:hypothetical protein